MKATIEVSLGGRTQAARAAPLDISRMLGLIPAVYAGRLWKVAMGRPELAPGCACTPAAAVAPPRLPANTIHASLVGPPPQASDIAKEKASDVVDKLKTQVLPDVSGAWQRGQGLGHRALGLHSTIAPRGLARWGPPACC